MATSLYSLAINTNSAGQFCTNVVHYAFDDAGYGTTAAAAAALANKWDTSVKAAYLAMLPDQVALLSLKARKAQGVGGFEAVKLYGAGNSGTRVGGISASGLAPVLIHFPVDRRMGRGKTFLPGCREADLSAGVFTAAFQSAVATQLAVFTADLILAGGGTPTAQFVIKSDAGAPGYWHVGESQLSDMLGQQRRRQRPS